MTRRELCERAARILRMNDCRKTVHLPKQTLRVQLGKETRLFPIRAEDRDILYTIEDVDCVLEAVTSAIVQAMRNGEETAIMGFGKFAPKEMKPRRIQRVDTREWITTKGKYVASFDSGIDLKTAAAVYTAKMREAGNPFLVDGEIEEDLDADPTELDSDDNEGGEADA